MSADKQSTEHHQLATQVIHGGKAPQDPEGALVAPLYQTSTFKFSHSDQGSARFAGEEPGYIYSRLGNPTVTQLETRVAALEGFSAAAASATGMGAIAATTMALVRSGDHVLVSDAIYGCSFALFSDLFERFGVKAEFIDMADASQVTKHLRDNTRFVFLETPANPHLKLLDIAAIKTAMGASAAKLIVDNTFMTPLLQHPKSLGADIVIHSATKFLNGHGDVVAGIVCGDEETIADIKMTTLKDMGATMSPHDAWLILRGLKTLDVRMQRHCDNAEKVVSFLQQHELIKKIYYPGLASHPKHDLVGSQMQRAGAVIAFELHSDEQGARAFLDALEMIALAVSLGDAETLIQHPASMTHSPYTPEARQAAGISDTLLRIAVGLEDANDIIADLKQALDSVASRWRDSA